MSTIRYHVRLNSHRTTVCVDETLSELMAIKLGAKPGTAEAHALVRKQIDQFVERDRGRKGYGLARYVKREAALFITDKKLSESYYEYLMEELEKKPSFFQS